MKSKSVLNCCTTHDVNEKCVGSNCISRRKMLFVHFFASADRTDYGANNGQSAVLSKDRQFWDRFVTFVWMYRLRPSLCVTELLLSLYHDSRTSYADKQAMETVKFGISLRCQIERLVEELDLSTTMSYEVELPMHQAHYTHFAGLGVPVLISECTRDPKLHGAITENAILKNSTIDSKRSGKRYKKIWRSNKIKKAIWKAVKVRTAARFYVANGYLTTLSCNAFLVQLIRKLSTRQGNVSAVC